MRRWTPANRPSSTRSSTRRLAARAVASATSTRKACFARNRIDWRFKNDDPRKNQEGQGCGEKAGQKNRQENRQVKGRKVKARRSRGNGEGQGRCRQTRRAGREQQPAAAFHQTLGTGRQGARRD